ncbi:hypothetical protein PspLS_02075 [Pyricularia sp. CBS 133598]|nr:hypothetical protein PspLS_02075 [Pyricularia sp. CBS 133598]
MRPRTESSPFDELTKTNFTRNEAFETQDIIECAVGQKDMIHGAEDALSADVKIRKKRAHLLGFEDNTAFVKRSGRNLEAICGNNATVFLNNWEL